MVLLLASCGPNGGDSEDLHTRAITLPDGSEIRAEVLVKPAEIQRGMMYREALPHRRGLLFVHSQSGPYRYWMPHVKDPLDIVFLDPSRRIVEISADTPPCTTKEADCPTYGGHYQEQFVLELRAGEAKLLGLSRGQVLQF